jgi:hypothetical protein
MDPLTENLSYGPPLVVIGRSYIHRPTRHIVVALTSVRDDLNERAWVLRPEGPAELVDPEDLSPLGGPVNFHSAHWAVEVAQGVIHNNPQQWDWLQGGEGYSFLYALDSAGMWGELRYTEVFLRPNGQYDYEVYSVVRFR